MLLAYAMAKVRPEADCAGKGADLWIVDSANSTGWRRGLGFLRASCADAVCLQEHMQNKEDACDEASAKARGAGWSLSLGRAVQTPAGGASAGAAVGGRSHFGLGRPRVRPNSDEAVSRIHVAWFSGVVRGGIHLISVYLWTGEPPSGKRNREVLELPAQVIDALDGPWVVAGDWQIPRRL